MRRWLDDLDCRERATEMIGDVNPCKGSSEKHAEWVRLRRDVFVLLQLANRTLRLRMTDFVP